jgi:aminopeptidase N
MKRVLLSALIFATLQIEAQHLNQKNGEDWKKLYRETPRKVNDLVHTKLDVSFDYDKAYLYGKAWLTLTPHFYKTDSVEIDAKGMDIATVAIVKGGKNTNLKYNYSGKVITIKLDRWYNAGEAYTLYIQYTAKPNEYKAEGSAAITDAKGLYFINPTGKEKNKPTQIWTQGETEATSVWCPTIDKPNQKTTQEISMTVLDKYVSLSNGKLISQKKNTNGTRTDVWKMDLPHAPYLFFMGVGDFAVVKDSYNGMEVSYYVEKEYEKVARRIFGETPAMIRLFEKLTGVKYPWVKYAQMTARDYVSGAMENTTATLHQESAQQNARELMDGNGWEGTIAHELFHQWFGDYVTAESWSNLTVNESFANYSQTLWREFRYGKDDGADENYTDMMGYLQSNSAGKDLVRFNYSDKEDMFDAVSYNKGGRILHMLRHYLGDSAFFTSLQDYLITNKFGTGEAHQLRLSFEKITGQDLNWFFNQWYFGAGHPRLTIAQSYDADKQAVTVSIKQIQTGDKVFRLPIDIDVYQGSQKTRHRVWMTEKNQEFILPSTTPPNLVNVDADKILLAVKTYKKTIAEYIHQYTYAGNYMDRKEAIDSVAQLSKDAVGTAFLKTVLNDPFYKFRNRAISSLEERKLSTDAELVAQIEKMAKLDPHRLVRANAISFLASTGNNRYQALYEKNVFDSSYSVAGAALEALCDIDETKALGLLPELSKDAKGSLKEALDKLEVYQKTDADFNDQYSNFTSKSLFERFQSYEIFVAYLTKVTDTDNFKKGVDAVVAFRTQVVPFAAQLKDIINDKLLWLKKKKLNAKGNATEQQKQADYIDSKVKE